MKNKLALLLVVVMISVVFIGCSASVEEYTEEFKKMEMDFTSASIEFSLEVSNQLENLEVGGFNAVEDTRLMVIVGDMIILQSKFEEIEAPSSIEEQHNKLVSAYFDYTFSADDFRLAIADSDMSKAITAMEDLSEAGVRLGNAEEEMVKELGL